MKDRFFLEEIIKRLDDAGQWDTMDEYPKQLMSDWMYELIQENELKPDERVGTCIEYQGDEWPDFYFESDEVLMGKIGKQ